MNQKQNYWKMAKKKTKKGMGEVSKAERPRDSK